MLYELEQWHEDTGPVLWWRLPVAEPPWVGTPLDSDWKEGYYTHFTRLRVPADPRVDAEGETDEGVLLGDPLLRCWQRQEEHKCGKYTVALRQEVRDLRQSPGGRKVELRSLTSVVIFPAVREWVPVEFLLSTAGGWEPDELALDSCVYNAETNEITVYCHEANGCDKQELQAEYAAGRQVCAAWQAAWQNCDDLTEDRRKAAENACATLLELGFRQAPAPVVVRGSPRNVTVR